MNSNAVKTLGKFVQRTNFDRGIGALLPEAYKKFYKEWKHTEPTAVHYIPEEGRWKRDEVTNQVLPIQNNPLPLKYPAEFDDQLWGGDAIVQGFQKRDEYDRRVPHFWVPHLHRSVVYSEVLDKYISVVVTNRTFQMIHDNFGFDHYLLKTPACDLKSLLALRLKRNILQELQKGCPSYSTNAEKQQEVMSRYKEYLTAYTPEEIEWYGYSFKEACKIMQAKIDAANEPVPLKNIYRGELLEKLRAAKIAEAQNSEIEVEESSSSWMHKINPFAKKHET